MTNLEKINALCLFPVKEASLLSVLEDRGITSTSNYDPTNSAEVKAMQLAMADVFCLLLTSPASVSEGGYSLSAPDRAVLVNMASSIYTKYGEELSGILKRPVVRAKSPW